MSDEIIITAKTLDEAVAKAEAEYGAKGDISYDILEMPKKGFLGLGAVPAKIKVTITPAKDVFGDILDKNIEKSKADREKAQKKKENKEAQPKKQNNASKPNKPKTEQPKADKPKAESKTEQPKAEAPKADKPKADKPKVEPKAEQPKAEQPKAEVKEESAEQKSAKVPKKKEPVRRERAKIVISQEEMDIALGFINELLKNMNSEASAIQATPPEDAVFEGVYPKIEIVGDHSGILIGHHGETLDAIQFLANLCVNRKTGSTGREFVKINVDIENYRAKREETLRSLARRMANKAIKYKRNVVLEPMNPYERHIIHSELQEMENVDTHSVGSDENRKVVITYEGADKAEQKKSSGRRNSRKGRRDTPKAPPARKISEEESAKIQETYAAYQEEKAGRERPKRATSIDEILGMSDDPDEPLGL